MLFKNVYLLYYTSYFSSSVVKKKKHFLFMYIQVNDANLCSRLDAYLSSFQVKKKTLFIAARNFAAKSGLIFE